MKKKIAIMGAGIAGLTLANFIKKYSDHEFMVYEKEEGSIHKVAAKIMGAESWNGWTYWHCNINGSTVVIDSLRQKFISERQI